MKYCIKKMKEIIDKVTHTENRIILGYLFLGLMGIYDLFLMSTTSTFFLPFSDEFQRYLFLVLLIAVILKNFIYITNLINQKERCDSFSLGLTGLCLAAVYFMVYRADRFIFLLFLGVLTLGCVGIDYRKILKLHVVLLALFLAVTCFSALGGAIDNFVFMKDGSIRSSWGICYPTDFASAVFFLCLFAWVVLNRVPDILMLPIAVSGVWFAKNIAMSITSTLCFVVFAGVLVLRVLSRLLLKTEFCRNMKNCKSLTYLGKHGRWLLVMSFPLLGLTMFGLLFFYAKGYSFALVINNLLSNRLELSLDMYRECGLKMFGTPFAQIGSGFSTYAAKDYNFIDSTYPLILLRYGWVLFLSYCVLWPWTVYKAIQCRDWRLAWVMALIALHSFSEHHFIELNYNVLVAMPLARYRLTETAEENQLSLRNQNRDGRKKALVFTGTAFLIALCFLSEALSRMRTITEMLGWYGGGRNGLKVIAVVAAGIGLVLGLLYCIYQIALHFSRKNIRAYRRWLIPGAFCIVALAGAFIKVDAVIHNGSVRYIDALKMDEPVLREILSVAEGKVYVHGIPQIYRNRFEGISTSVFDGDELARCYDTTVLMDKNYDSSCFVNSGFLFMPISEVHAVYTNDMSVIRGMEKKGYHLTGYYSVEKEANLEALRNDNELAYNGKGLYLDGPEHSLIHGPYLSLYSGKYSVWYDLQIDKDIISVLREKKSAEEKSQEEYTVVEGTQGDILLGTARVSAYYGQQVIKEQGIYLSDFNEYGFASVEVPFNTGSYPGIEFLVILQDGLSMTLNSMRYARTPEYDVHAFYDRNRLKYRDEYYTLEGKREELPDGYFAVEYGYNYDRAVNEVRYYDLVNKPVLIKAGYAQVKRVLDGKNRVIREEYYDEDGERILLPQGYSANEREYDEEGNAIVQRYYDSDNNPVLTIWGYSEIHRLYDEERRIIREAYYGTDGKPLSMPQGYMVTEREYDENDNLIVQRYCDASGSPVMTTWNYAELRREFNVKRLVVKECYYDTKGNLTALPSGQAEVHREYNNKNQVILEAYYGIDGQPVKLSQGYAMNEREYDENGNAVVQRYCDESGNPVMTTWNYAEVHRVFDEQQRVAEESYYDTEGKPLALPSGQAEVHREYNDKNQVIKESYFGLDRQPVKLPQGYEVNEREYDDNGNAVVQRYCDASGIPVMTIWNYAEVHRVFDEQRRVVEESYYDTEGKPLALPAGQAEVHREYNDKNQVIKESYFGLDGQPVNMPQGYAVVEREYDEAGNVAVQRFYDGIGVPVITTWNYAEIHREFNDKKQIVLETYYDTEGRPMTLPTGQACEERSYNDVGNLETQKFYDLNDQPVMLTGGFSSVRREYDKNGQQTRIIYYDLEGKEVQPLS